MSRDYDTLVAAHLLRNPQFATDYGPLILKTEGHFFDSIFVRDPVVYGIERFVTSGRLLPPQALKADVHMFGENGASAQNYDLEIDKIWEIPDRYMQDSRSHVEARLVAEVQSRLISYGLDLEELASPGSISSFFEAVEEIRTLGAVSRGGALRLSEGLLESLTEPPKGVPTGIAQLDAVLPGGGTCPGETLIYFGYRSIGKSIMIHHSVRHTALHGFVPLLWSHENGLEQVRWRMIQGFLGWTREEITAEPHKAYRLYMEQFGDLPLFIQHSPPGVTKKIDIISQIDRIEQRIGRKVDLLAMDYSEKRATGRDWNNVADAYQEIREICGERGMAGLDVAQENDRGDISYKNLMKDADVGVQLTVMMPSEWNRRQKSMSVEDKLKIPPIGPIYGEVHRSREGKSGDEFSLWVDRARSQVRPRQMGDAGEEEDDDA